MTSAGPFVFNLDDVVLLGGVYECNAVRPGEPAAPGRADPLRIDRDGGAYALSWGAPPSGGAPDDYVLYSMPLDNLDTRNATCDGSLGAGTSAVVAALRNDSALLVVARNSEGEGGYGRTSSGVERPAAITPCP